MARMKVEQQMSNTNRYVHVCVCTHLYLHNTHKYFCIHNMFIHVYIHTYIDSQNTLCLVYKVYVNLPWPVNFILWVLVFFPENVMISSVTM